MEAISKLILGITFQKIQENIRIKEKQQKAMQCKLILIGEITL